MKPQDRGKFAEIITSLADAYDKTLSDTLLGLYFTTLSDLTIEEVAQAAGEILQSRVYTKMPMPADFLEKIRGSDEDRGLVEAGKVWDAIKHQGYWSSVCFDDPVTHAVIERRFGGWIRTCIEADNQMWWEKEFASAYKAYARTKIKLYGHLQGQNEIDNISNGHKHRDSVTLLGNKEKARQLMETGGVGQIEDGTGGAIKRLADGMDPNK